MYVVFIHTILNFHGNIKTSSWRFVSFTSSILSSVLSAKPVISGIKRSMLLIDLLILKAMVV